MTPNYADTIALAKSVTELAIQKDLITARSNTEETAVEIANFYTTFVKEITNVSD